MTTTIVHDDLAFTIRTTHFPGAHIATITSTDPSIGYRVTLWRAWPIAPQGDPVADAGVRARNGGDMRAREVRCANGEGQVIVDDGGGHRGAPCVVSLRLANVHSVTCN